MITPLIKGDQWKLITSNKIHLSPEPPFPNSTAYTIKINNGTTSIMNDSFTKEFLYSFTTTMIHIVQRYPSGGLQTISPVLFLAFDQTIEPKEIINVIKCELGKSKKSHPLTMLSSNRAMLEYPVIRPFIQNSNDNKWLALIPTKPFPYDTKVTITIGPNIPSAEGPVKSDIEDSFSFNTVPIFAVSSMFLFLLLNYPIPYLFFFFFRF